MAKTWVIYLLGITEAAGEEEKENGQKWTWKRWMHAQAQSKRPLPFVPFPFAVWCGFSAATASS
jgi:hypothetical protein